MYDYKHIKVELVEGGIAVMSFICPEKLNSWSKPVLDDMHDFFSSVKNDFTVRVIILRGEGERAFSTGADFTGLFAEPQDRNIPSVSFAIQEELREIVTSVHNAPQVIVCACHGYAVGGGFFIAMASDIRIITDDVKFSAPLLKLGLSCGDLGCAYLLPRLIGDGVARDILLTGRYMCAEEAIRLGFASECVPAGELDATAMKKAKALAEYTPQSLRYSKELLNILEDVDNLDTAIRIENRNTQFVKAINREK